VLERISTKQLLLERKQ
jgi:hypothetical protein